MHTSRKLEEKNYRNKLEMRKKKHDKIRYTEKNLWMKQTKETSLRSKENELQSPG